ncbi:MAG: UDP-N-acetylmuramoyl-L-alanyl-D-glutamate--2,6-diaminopimelate ligase, partial [Flavobacteriaceae bacterium]|nr:UDP-N-acetylmuramoyl-L-alanyl-D-glutamate--2,6-diaminopimelate ligase [Flavobacteriaceae bacterium]
MKTLKEILYKVSTEGVFGSTLVKISSLSFDSRNIKKNSLYVAKKGIHLDGHDFIKKSIEKGAAAIVCNKLPEEVIDGITYIIVNNTSKALGILASNFYDNPSEKLNLVGITGTNGKTSVAFFLHQLFSSHSLKCGLLSTIKIKYLDREFNNSSTTPDIITINNLLNDMVKEGVDFCFMEVSSHGIAQDRIYGLSFKAGVFTNLTHDHLDYHGNFKNYRDTKKQFFDNLSDSAFALTNIDDKNGSFMLQNTKAKKYTYATKFHADYMVKILECQFSGMLLKIQNHEVWSSLIGHFNSQNLLAVYAI